MRTCENCKYSEPMVGALACMGQKGMPYVRPTDSCDNWKTMKQTNADRIRAMTDEGLATYHAKLVGCPKNVVDYRGCNAALECKASACWLDWLKQEATP